MSDEELMNSYNEGELIAFETLYKRHGPKVLGFLKAKGCVAPDELMQEVFLKLHKNRTQYAAQYPFLPWFFTLVRNVWLDSLKKSENQIESKKSDLAYAEGIAAENVSTDLRELAFLNHLPSDQKRAIELRYLSEWSFEQIARELQTTPQNVRQLVSRGIKKIKNVVGFKDEL